ncbi:MAG: fluoride efflux transporter CrcB [Sphingobacteriales bacterium]|nr:MAG: fluoride efflux transporter CrcB [Sphingobacteriales bacterium]
MLRAFFIVGMAGAAGSMARYAVQLCLRKSFDSFPAATLVVNMTGCLLMGILLGLASTKGRLSPEVLLALATGFCGGFTTFSGFAADNLQLMERGLSMTAISYSVLSVFLGLVLCKAGHWIVTAAA